MMRKLKYMLRRDMLLIIYTIFDSLILEYASQLWDDCDVTNAVIYRTTCGIDIQIRLFCNFIYDLILSISQPILYVWCKFTHLKYFHKMFIRLYITRVKPTMKTP